MVNIDASVVVPAIGVITASIGSFNPFPYNPGFDIRKVTEKAIALPSHSWEYGTAVQAQLELYNPDISVFGRRPFPVPTLNKTDVRALTYLEPKVKFGTGYDALDRGNGAAGDPASMGVGAVLLGKTNATWSEAADNTHRGLLNDVPRFSNGAISHRFSVPELWADFVYMVPPFLAYYAADKQDEGLLQETVRQCGLYREILQDPNTAAPVTGAWRHIIGPQSQDVGLWATGNAWAAAGMTRVLATIDKATFITNQGWRRTATNQLVQYIKEIVDSAIAAPKEDDLLRNYLDDTTTDHGFGEVSGSSLIAAVIYRMVVLRPDAFADRKYLAFAESIRLTLGGNDKNGSPHVTDTGVVKPAVNPLNWQDVRPFVTGSPEGNAFVVLLYTGWRDCVKARKCRLTGPNGEDIAVEASVDVKRDLPAHRRNLNHLVHGSL